MASNSSRGSYQSNSSATPLPLREAIRQLPNQYFRVLTRPSATTFEEEKEKAAWDIVGVQLLIQIIGYVVISTLLRLIVNLFTPINNAIIVISIGIPEEFVIGTFLNLVSSILIAALFFFVSAGAFYLLAKLFGGQGKFLEQCYAMLLFQVPITILISLLWLIPHVSSYVLPALGVYSTILLFLAIMGVHNLSTGRAVAVLLISIALLPLLVSLLLSAISIRFIALPF